MSTAFFYLKKHPISIVAFFIYFISWITLFNWMPFAITIGEFPLGPVLAIPFCIAMLINAVFRKEDKLFYLSMGIIVIIPFLIISIVA